MTYDVGVIGTGSEPENPQRDGYAMAYRHAAGYEAREDCRLVACADIVPENAAAFADEFGVAHVYEDYEAMLAEVEPDIVSVCVPPGVHAELVIGCAESGVPAAIHCEKPMATTWGECREMVEVCERRDVQLTFNHQLRFSGPIREAKRRLDAGEIGDLRRVEFTENNLYDAGVHLFDVATYITDRRAVEWVMGQVDYREENVWFGAHNENHGLAVWTYEDGVSGLASTGEGEGVTNSYLHLQGTDGEIEVNETNPVLRVRRGGEWETVDTGGEGVYGVASSRLSRAVRTVSSALPVASTAQRHGATYTIRAIDDLVDALGEGRTPELDGRTALQATELVFATWESSRRRGRVDLPLDVEDNPLEAMVAAGDLDPRPAEELSAND